jgi:hypothetical protein
MATRKRTDRLEKQEQALERSRRKAFEALQKAEDELFRQTDRMHRRSSEASAVRARLRRARPAVGLVDGRGAGQVRPR